MKKNLRSIIAVVLALVLSLVCFTGCNRAPANAAVEIASGGVLCLKVNPEIAVAYDNNGNVTGVTARNDDALKILEKYSGFEGKAAKTVVVELIEAIGAAGYFVEEIDGERRHITLEIEPGSSLPSGTFLKDVIANVKDVVNSSDWKVPLDVEGESVFGLTDYVDTDYGVNNDGVTDYTDYNASAEATAPAGTAGKTDYDATDYGKTDYDATDYGASVQATEPATQATTPAAKGDATGSANASTAGKTDYTDYNEKNTDYGKTDYNDKNTDYGKTDYNDKNTDYGKTDYNEKNTDYGKTDYNDKNTDYGKTDYDATDYGTSTQVTEPAKDAASEPAKDAVSEPAKDSASASQNAGTSNSGTSNSGTSNSGSTNNTDYGKTDYNDKATDYGKTDYNDKATDYGKTDYDATDYGTAK